MPNGDANPEIYSNKSLEELKTGAESRGEILRIRNPWTGESQTYDEFIEGIAEQREKDAKKLGHTAIDSGEEPKE